MTELGTVNQAVTGTDSFEARAARGTAWSMIGLAVGLALRFVGNVVLTRLLFEEAFGLMLLVQVFLMGLQLFSDFGIPQSIIQNKRGADPVFVNTAFTIQAGRGLILWMITWAGALPFAAFYNEPTLAWVLPSVGFTALLGGLYSTKLLTAHRELAMGRLTIIDLVSQVAGLVVMIAWVTIRPSVWALVAGGIVSCMVLLVLSHTALPGPRNRLEWNAEAGRAMLHFGKWIFISTMLTFLASQADRLIFGKLFDMKLLGVYSIAIILATLPAQVMGNINYKIIFPLFSRVYNEGSDLAAAYRRRRWPLLVLGGWAIAGLVGGGPTIVRLFYDNRYEDAGWILQMVAMGSWFGGLLESTNSAALLAGGLTRRIAARSAGKLVGLIILLPIGYAVAGFPGAVAGVASTEFVYYAISALAVRRQGLHGLDQDGLLTLITVGASLVGWLAATVIRQHGWPVAVEAVAVFLAVSLTWLPLALPFVAHRRSKNIV